MADQNPAPELTLLSAIEWEGMTLQWTGWDEGWPDVQVQRRIYGNAQWTSLDILAPTVASYDDYATSPDVHYEYRVKPTGYVASNIMDEWTYPGAVTDLVVTAEADTPHVDLSWTNGTHGATASTRIYYRLATGGEWSYSAQTLRESHHLTGLEQGREYEFYVVIRGGGSSEGEPSATVNETTNIFPPYNPVAYATSGTSIEFSWDCDGDAGNDGYDIWVDGALAQHVESGTLSYEFTGLTLEQVYEFKVRALGPINASYSSFSTPIECTSVVAPGEPTMRTATTIDHEGVNVTWTLADINATSIEIWRSSGLTKDPTGADVLVYTTATGDITGYNYADLPFTGDTYYFWVVPKNSGGQFAAAAITGATDPLIVPPINIVGEALSDSQVELTWELESDDVDEIHVYWRVPSGSWTDYFPAGIDPAETTYVVGGLPAGPDGITYEFKMTTVFEATESDDSQTVEVTTEPAGTVPDDLESFFGMAGDLNVMTPSLQGVRDLTRTWISKELDFADQDSENFHHWKFIKKIQLEYEDDAIDCPITISISHDHGQTWHDRTQNVGEHGEGHNNLKDFRGFGLLGGDLAASVPGVYFQIKLTCSDREKDVPWTGMFVHYQRGGEHFDTGYLD